MQVLITGGQTSGAMSGIGGTEAVRAGRTGGGIAKGVGDMTGIVASVASSTMTKGVSSRTSAGIIMRRCR